MTKTRQKNKTAKANGGAGAAFAIGEREKARVERWRGQIAKRLDEIADCPAFIPAAWLEEIEERPMADVLTDMLVRERLTGGAGKPSKDKRAEIHNCRECDEYQEDRGTRARNNHENQLAHMLVLDAMRKSRLVPDEWQHEFVRRFYRAGDRSLINAEARAVRCAMEWEREADKAETAPA